VVVVIAVVIVVMIVPVAVRMPTTFVLVPPPVCVRPAVFTRLVQLLARVCRLSTIPSVVFDRLVQPMIGFYDAPLACPFIGTNHRSTDKSESPCQRHGRKHRLSPKWLFRVISHFYSALLTIDCDPV
jgi:hypothetical protein